MSAAMDEVRRSEYARLKELSRNNLYMLIAIFGKIQ